jgi:lipopolysaccharide transport system ATP-binding protein
MQDAAGKEGRTVLFVSHSIAAITRLCQRVIYLQAGAIKADGSTALVIADYLSSATSKRGVVEWPEGFSNRGIHDLKFSRASVLGMGGQPTVNLDQKEPFTLEIAYTVYDPLPFCRVGFVLSTLDGVPVFEVYDIDNDSHPGRRRPGRFVARCAVPGALLNVGRYLISLNAGIPYVRNLAYADAVLEITVHDHTSSIAAANVPRAGMIRLPAKWNIEAV